MPNLESEQERRERIVSEIGRVILNWNLAEAMMDNIVAHALRVPLQTAEIIMGGFASSPKADILLSVIRARFPDDPRTTETEKCANRFKSLSGFRNSVAHGRLVETAWGDGKEIEESTVIQKKFTQDELSVEHLFQKSEELRKLCNRLNTLAQSFSA